MRSRPQTLTPLRWRRRHHDVVFHTPWVGSMLSHGNTLPPGGAEVQVLMLAKALARCGLRVAIIAFGRRGELPGEVDGVAIVRRTPWGRGKVIRKFLEPFKIWWSLWRAPSATVVHRTAGIELGFVGLYTTVARRRFVFSTANVVDFGFRELMPNGLYQLVYELGVRFANAIVVQTEEQQELCEATFGRHSFLIKSLAELKAPQDGIPEAFLWIARLVEYKRPLDYIALADAVPEARFWMVGVPASGESGKRLLEVVTTAAAHVPNLELLSPRRHDEIEELMARAVASVNTADYEGMPNVLLEAWSRGVPALVLKHDPGGVVMRHNLGGFANDSPDAMVQLARELWATRAKREAVAQRCRAYVAEHHAPEVVAQQWLDVVSRPMAACKQPPAERDVRVRNATRRTARS